MEDREIRCPSNELHLREGVDGSRRLDPGTAGSGTCVGRRPIAAPTSRASHLHLRATVAAMASCFAHAFFCVFCVFRGNSSSRIEVGHKKHKRHKKRGVDATGGQSHSASTRPNSWIILAATKFKMHAPASGWLSGPGNRGRGRVRPADTSQGIAAPVGLKGQWASMLMPSRLRSATLAIAATEPGGNW